MRFEDVELNWLGHASFRIRWNNKIIYIDPFKLETDENADFIFITHSHYDHCSLQDIEKIVKDETVFVIPNDCLSKVRRFNKKMVLVHPDEEVDLGFKVLGIAAYNIDKSFHEKINEWLGYVLTLGNVKIYHAGDTDFVPEMYKLTPLNIDIALLPVGGTYTMDWQEAAKAVEAIKPKIAIPMHYGTIVGNANDALRFKKALEGKYSVEILKQEK